MAAAPVRSACCASRVPAHVEQIARGARRGALDVVRARAVPGGLAVDQRIDQVGNREALADAGPDVDLFHAEDDHRWIVIRIEHIVAARGLGPAVGGERDIVGKNRERKRECAQCGSK